MAEDCYSPGRLDAHHSQLSARQSSKVTTSKISVTADMTVNDSTSITNSTGQSSEAPRIRRTHRRPHAKLRSSRLRSRPTTPTKLQPPRAQQQPVTSPLPQEGPSKEGPTLKRTTEKGQPRCISIKLDGFQCTSKAQEDREYCGRHPRASAAEQVPEGQLASRSCNRSVRSTRASREGSANTGRGDSRVYRPLSDTELHKWIPSYLSLHARSKLNSLMEWGPSKKDREGYIYAIQVQDDDAPQHYHIKIGRTTDLDQRMKQWRRCGLVDVLGWWPRNLKGKNRSIQEPGPKGKHHQLLERLIQTEIADISRYSPHLISGDLAELQGDHEFYDDALENPSSSGKWPYKRKACINCEKVHKEIYALKRDPNGELTGREWEYIVKPIIKGWGKFVTEYYG